MNYHKCSDFVCFKLPGISTIIKIKDDDKRRLASHAWGQTVFDFKQLLLKQTLGQDFTFFQINYACFTDESVKEFLNNLLNIYWHDDRILIPVQYKNLIQWMHDNVPKGTKILKRFHVTYLFVYHDKTKFGFSEDAHKFSVDHMSKYGYKIEKLDLSEVEKIKSTL
jgi:hypothetical protein